MQKNLKIALESVKWCKSTTNATFSCLLDLLIANLFNLRIQISKSAVYTSFVLYYAWNRIKIQSDIKMWYTLDDKWIAMTIRTSAEHLVKSPLTLSMLQHPLVPILCTFSKNISPLWLWSSAEQQQKLYQIQQTFLIGSKMIDSWVTRYLIGCYCWEWSSSKLVRGLLRAGKLFNHLGLWQEVQLGFALGILSETFATLAEGHSVMHNDYENTRGPVQQWF